MKWYSTRLDKPPKDKQEVLISTEGVNMIAIYDANRKCFVVEGKTKAKNFKADETRLYWTEYTRPGKN
jgi:hypothetical protein